MSQQITALLSAWGRGEPGAEEELCPLVYNKLRRLARGYMRHERAGHILQTTALVHETWLRLINSPHVDWHNRTQFFALSAQLMRRILVDYARRHHAKKRGGSAVHLSLNGPLKIVQNRSEELIALDKALQELTAVDPRKGRVVELRFFGGLSVEEAAEVLKISPDTVMRDWKFARSWLRRELGRQKQHAA